MACLDREHMLAKAIVDTISQPLLVLDRDLNVVMASRAFCRTFDMDAESVRGRGFHTLGGGQWSSPDLRHRLERILPERSVMQAYELEHDFGDDRRIMLLSARTLESEGSARDLILLAFEIMNPE